METNIKYERSLRERLARLESISADLVMALKRCQELSSAMNCEALALEADDTDGADIMRGYAADITEAITPAIARAKGVQS